MPLNAARLLIIDDEPDSVSLLLSYLEGHDFDILVALDGPDGLSKAHKGQPDLILLDVVMTGMDGFEVLRGIQANPLTEMIPVIFLSGRCSLEERLQGFKAGASDYISKPFSEAEVLARVKVHLRAKRRMDFLEVSAGKKAIDLVGARSPGDDALFNAAVRLLTAGLAEPPSFAELLRQLRTSERRLNQLFRRKVGMSVFDYFAELRMETARHLLAESDCLIQVIAHRVGYQNAGDLTRAFRRRYKVGPRDYRRSVRQSKSTEK